MYKLIVFGNTNTGVNVLSDDQSYCLLENVSVRVNIISMGRSVHEESVLRGIVHLLTPVLSVYLFF